MPFPYFFPMLGEDGGTVTSSPAIQQDSFSVPVSFTVQGTDISTYPGLDQSFTVTNKASLYGERILRRITTPKGFMSFHQNYGEDVRAYLNASIDDQTLALIKYRIQYEILQDEYFLGASVSVTYDYETSVLTLGITANTSDGPFAFVIDVTKLTAVLVSTSEA